MSTHRTVLSHDRGSSSEGVTERARFSFGPLGLVGSGLVAVAARCRVGAATAGDSVLRDLGAGGRDRPPFGPEGVDALAARLSLAYVLDEGVERVVVVGDLQASIRPLRRSEQRCLRSLRGER